MRGAASTGASRARGTGVHRSRKSGISTCFCSLVRLPPSPSIFRISFLTPLGAQGSTGLMASGRQVGLRVTSLSRADDSCEESAAEPSHDTGYSPHTHRIIGYQRILDLSFCLDRTTNDILASRCMLPEFSFPPRRLLNFPTYTEQVRHMYIITRWPLQAHPPPLPVYRSVSPRTPRPARRRHFDVSKQPRRRARPRDPRATLRDA